jgi:hypothetical protein
MKKLFSDTLFTTKKTMSFLTVAAALTLSTQVQATVVDFSEYSNFLWVTNTSFTTQDYTITTSGSNLIANTATCGPSCPDNGGYYFLAHGGSFSISKTNGDSFSLLDFDLGEAHHGTNIEAEYINVSDGLTSQNYFLDGINDGNGVLVDFQNVSTVNTFNNVTSLTFTGFNNSKFFSIDNLNFGASSAIPEPASLSLLGLGLAGIFFSRKKKTV